MQSVEKNGLSVRAATKEIENVAGPGTVIERVAQNLFRCFKESDTNLKDKPSSGKSSVVENEALLD